MKNNKIYLSLLFLLVVGLSFVGAAVISPANGVTVTGGNIVLNATNASLPHIVNCTFYTGSASTANVTWVSLGTAVNLTANVLALNTTFNTSQFEDSNNYHINATCRNVTNQATDSVGTASVVFDNTIPTAATSVSPADATIDADGSIIFSGTVTGSDTTGCTLEFPSVNFGGASQAMTHTGNSCTITLSNVPDQSYRWFIRASDGSNTTDASTLTVTSDVKTSSGKAALLAQQPGVRSGGGALLFVSNIADGLPGGMTTLILSIIAILVVVVIARKK